MSELGASIGQLGNGRIGEAKTKNSYTLTHAELSPPYVGGATKHNLLRDMRSLNCGLEVSGVQEVMQDNGRGNEWRNNSVCLESVSHIFFWDRPRDTFSMFPPLGMLTTSNLPPQSYTPSNL